MTTKKKISTSILAALTVLGGSAATVELTTQNGVDAIISDNVASAENVKSTMTLLKWRGGEQLERLKTHLLPLATTIKNDGYVDVLKLDEYYALLSFGANIEVKQENGESFNKAIRRYLENNVK